MKIQNTIRILLENCDVSTVIIVDIAQINIGDAQKEKYNAICEFLRARKCVIGADVYLNGVIGGAEYQKCRTVIYELLDRYNINYTMLNLPINHDYSGRSIKIEFKVRYDLKSAEPN